MAADLAFLTHLHGPQHHAVPCTKTRYRSRTEEVRGSNPLTSTPNLAGQSAARSTLAALAACWGRAGAANALGRVLDVDWAAAAEAGRPSEHPSLNSVCREQAGAPVVQDLPGGRCPLVIVVLDVQASQHSNRPCCSSYLARYCLYGNGPRARYCLGLENYRNEPIPDSGGPA
jgi:hypothetical protein